MSEKDKDIDFRSYPEFLSIFLTTRCNLRCLFCRPTGYDGLDLDFSNLPKLDMAIERAQTIDLTGWGEPLLYPRFDDVVRYVTARNVRSDLLFITTNGSLLSKDKGELLDKHLNKLIISINAATPETYHKINGGDFNRTITNTAACINALSSASRARTTLHFVASTHNYHEIPAFVELASKLHVPSVSVGACLALKLADYEHSLLHIKEQYNWVVNKAREIASRVGVAFSAGSFAFTGDHTPGTSREICQSPFREVYISTVGQAGPCCFAGYEPMGNVYETSFEAVWFGERYKRLRKSRFFPACGRCMACVPFDNVAFHFIDDVKRTKEYREKFNSIRIE